MTWQKYACVAAVAAALAATGSPSAYAVTDDDLAQIRQSIQQLEKQHDEDAKRIKELENRLKVAEAKSNTIVDRTLSSAAATSSQLVTQQPTATQTANAPVEASPTPVQNAPASASAFNPAIGVVLMGTYGHFSRNPENAPIHGFMLGDEAKDAGPRGFSLGESEVNFSANIDQALYGQLVASLSPEGEAEVEEGFIQTTSLPWGFTAKAGRFFSGIGYLNEQHAHAWDFLDAPLPYRAMLNNQLGDDGVQIRWTAPTETFLQFGVEGLRGDKFPATATNQGAGAQSFFVKAGGDVDESNSWLASAAYYHANAKDMEIDSDTFTGATHLGIAGLVWKWAPNGNPVERNLKLQGEYFFRHQDGTFDNLGYHGDQSGFYTQAVYQFMPQWSIGARYDQVSASNLGPDFTGTTLDNLGPTPRRYSGVLSFSTSEFGKFRLQYTYDDSASKPSQGVMVNYTISMGSHGAHQY